MVHPPTRKTSDGVRPGPHGDGVPTPLETAKLLLTQNRLAEAHEALWAVIRADEARGHEPWLRLGELYAARRQLRRAVGAFRRAQELDARGDDAFVLHEAISSIGQVLHHLRRPILHPADELVRNRHLVAGTTPQPPSAAQWLDEAMALEPTLPDGARAALAHATGFVRGGGLDESFSEQSLARELEVHGGEGTRALAESLRALHLARYDALLAVEEPLG